MATNNGWNAAYLAGTAQAIAGTETRSVINPASLQGALDQTRLHLPYYENLGLSKSGATFSVTSASGSALSSVNYAKITLPSNVSRGTLKTYTLTANQSCVDATGSSTLVGNTFGTTAGVAWGNSMPFFLYCGASTTDTSPVFFISRLPFLQQTPAATDIGQSGSAIADTEYSVFALSSITAANYANVSLAYMGCFEMTSKSSGDDWTISALSSTLGLGMHRDRQLYLYPTGQRTAATGGYILDNGGTAPSFANQAIYYSIERSGHCKSIVFLDNTAGGTAGAGAVTTFVTAPFRVQLLSGLTEFYMAAGMHFNGGTKRGIIFSPDQTTNGLLYITRTDDGSIILNNKLNNQERRVGATLYYKVAIS